jgi:hypothetical protein
MNGRIFTCHHVAPERVVATSLFSTLISGAPGDGLTGLISDLDGRNIAEPNWHSEMRHQYHVWQDRLDGLDYVGFEHYRRIFFINPLTAPRMRRFNPWLLEVANQLLIDELCVGGVLDHTLFNAYQDLREICEGEMKSHMDFVMNDADIITHRVQPLRLDEQFKQCHPPEHWDIFTQAVQETRFFAQSGGMIDFRLRATFFCNMHVMRTAFFRQYMDFWWETTRKLEQRLPLTERYLGYFAERLVNLFVNGLRHQMPRLRVRALPFVAYQ